ncbi:hypothetical protein FRB90_011104 [Tulasnella sp. 427]|nr:hypothetical protein FRB90_011104 [Tulasnella sp. 427]
MAPPNTYEERSTPGLGDDADMDADDQLSQDGGASAASTSAGAHHHLASGSNATGRGATSVRTRITVVCAEQTEKANPNSPISPLLFSTHPVALGDRYVSRNYSASASSYDAIDGLRVDRASSERPSLDAPTLLQQEKRRKKDVIPIVAPYSELDYHDAQRPKDLLAVGIAYQLFVGPATQAAMAAAGFGAPSIPGGQSATYPFTFSALGGANNAAQPNSPQLPNSPFGTHPNVASQPTSPPAPHITPPTTTSGGSSSNPARQSLLTPQHILAHLPSKEWRAVLLTEFESFMIVHEGVCGANRSLWRRRIERMFEWAEHFAERNGANGGAVAQGDSGAESGSQVSSSSHSGPGSSRAGKRKGKARSNAAMSTSGAGSGSSEHSLPPPPTMGLFAVACGVFAIGALCYACKATHGFNEAPRAEGKRKEMEVDPSAQKDGSSEAGGSVSSSVAAMPPPSLPFSVSFSLTGGVEETKFPSADVAAMQACDLHIMANALIMRLWFPFVKDFLGRPSLQSHQNAALACSTAANSIIVASKYMITRFRSTHPLHFGFYSFGRNVWLAATLLASILISMPQIIWAATCRKGLDVALSIARDQLLSGKLENGVNPKYEVIQLLQQLKSMAERFSNAAGGLPTGSKRKADEHVETVKMRHGFQIPFVGLAAVSAAGEIDVPLGRHETFQRSVSVNVPRTFTVPVDPLPSEDMEVSEEPAPSRPNPLPMPKTVRTRTTSQPAWPESSPSPYIVGANNGEYVPPAAATSFPPKSKVAKPPSEISQTSSLQGKSAPVVTSKRSFPVIGIRDRTKAVAKQPLQQDSGSSTEKGRSASESGPSRAKRPKSSSGGREGTPNSGVPSPAGRASQLQQTYPQPTPESATPAPGVMVSSVPPPIQQTAPPQPTYYAPPSRHVQSAAMSDVGSQVSIGGAGPAAQYRQTGPGSDYSSAFSAAPRNHQPQDYSMSMHSQGSNQQSSGYQQVQAREYGLPVAPHSNYMVDDALSTFSGGGSDYYTASVTNNSTYHHGPGSAVGTLAYTHGSGDGQAYGSAPQQQQQQHQMHIMSQHQNTNGYGSHQHYQSQTTQPSPSQPNFAQFAEPAPPQSQGWTTQDTNGSQLRPASLLITVSGIVVHGPMAKDAIQTGTKKMEAAPRVFSQAFVLMPEEPVGAEPKYYIASDTLRFVG